MASDAVLDTYRRLIGEAFWYRLENGESRFHLHAQLADIGRIPFDERSPLRFFVKFGRRKRTIFLWLMGLEAVYELHQTVGDIWRIKGYLNGVLSPGGALVEGVYDVRRRHGYVRQTDQPRL